MNSSKCKIDIVPVINDLKELIVELHKIFKEDNVDIDYAKKVLEAYQSNPKDWKQYAIYDQHRYTRNLVDQGNGKFNVMALCWGESHGSSVHDHSGSHCFVKVLDGNIQETLFDWPVGSSGKEDGVQPLEEKGKTLLGKNEVTYMSDELGLHRMENPSHSNTTMSLHVYSPPFSSCKAFDQRTGRPNTVKVTFWSKFGERQPCGSQQSCTASSTAIAENN